MLSLLHRCYSSSEIDYVHDASYSFTNKGHLYYLDNLRAGSIFVSLCNNIPAGKAKRKQSIETRKETEEKPYFFAGGEYEAALCRGTSRCFKVLSSDSDLLKIQFLWVK